MNKFIKYSFKKSAIDEVKAKQMEGQKNSVAGDAKYDSPGRK
jgi:hypothetical protein